MCLLIAFYRIHPQAPLILAANRDEFLSRPAVSMTVLQDSGPRILGGKDKQAGGTWLAVNEHGLFAGLTNLPSPKRDPSKRSRGELPLALVRHPDAKTAVEAFCQKFRPEDFNPAWLLAGDRNSLYYLDFTSGEKAKAEALGPGLYVLENKPLTEPSPKTEYVRKALSGAEALKGADFLLFLYKALKSHEIPEGAKTKEAPSRPERGIETQAACVHSGPYGTRSSAIVMVPPGPEAPKLWFTDGPPCTSPLKDASSLWS